MKVTFLVNYRQYTKGDEFNFDEFSILTGVNGSGKSNLLSAISSTSNVVLIDDQPVEQFKIQFYNYSSINHIPSQVNLTTRINSNDTYLGSIFSEHQDYLEGKILEKQISDRLLRFAKNIGKKLREITRSDFVELEINRDNERVELFKYNFFNDASLYIEYKERNIFNSFRNERLGENTLVLTKEEFLKKYKKPPWEILNNALEQLNFKYRFIQPRYHYRQGFITLKFYDTEIGEEVPIEYLSPGEKIILSFITSIYDSLVVNEIPEIILFDEVDALLHPSFVHKIIKIIDKIFINKMGCRVLFVTHSPSTVAVAPDHSIYLCERKDNTIRKISKDLALSRLTEGINSLSVNYENRRQIFVEDKDDEIFHRFLFNILRQNVHEEISLNFIPVGKVQKAKSGGCDKVRSIVNTLCRYGNTSVFGIVDSDEDSKKTSSPIFILEQRYSIENYIFDPIFVVAYLIREKIKDKEGFDLDDGFRYTDLEKLEEDKIQDLVNRVLDILDIDFDTEDTVLVEYMNEKRINIPKMYLRYPGHELEEIIMKISPKIIGKLKSHKSLKHAMIYDIIDDLRGFIPSEVINFYRKIQKA